MVKNGHTLCEDEYAYDVGLRLCRKLIQEGAMSYMITRDGNDGIRDDEILLCDRDETVWGGEKIPLSQLKRLEQRIDVVKSLYEKNKKIAPNGQYLLEIHVESFMSGVVVAPLLVVLVAFVRFVLVFV